MGIDVVALVKHELDTSGYEVLASQLAEKLNATVIYGYYDDWYEDGYDFSQGLEQDKENPDIFYLKENYYDENYYYFVTKGFAGNNEERVYQLVRHHYFDTILKPFEKHSIHFELFQLKPAPEEMDSTTIGKESLETLSHFPSYRWYLFLGIFGYNGSDDYYKEELQQYRKQVADEKRLLGAGGYVVYLPDSSCKTSRAYGSMYDWTWDEIINFLHHPGDDSIVVDLCNWVRNRTARVDIYKIGAVVDDFSWIDNNIYDNDLG